MWYIQGSQTFPVFTISFHHSKEVFVCCLIVSLRCVFWVGLSIRGGGNDSPRPASQRAAAFVLTAAMLITLAAPAFAGTWYIEDGDITISAGESGNNVTQNNNTTYGDTNTIITNQNKDKASSHTVTIETNDKNDKVEVTLKDVNIDTSSRNNAAVSVTGEGDTNIKLDGDNALKSDIYRSGIYGSGSGSLTISGGENDSLTAQGGSGANGISSSGSLTISGGTVTANGDDGGRGIYSRGGVTISGGSTVTAKGGDGGSFGGGSGISSFNRVAISGSTVTANGGDSSSNSGGYGISSLDVAISSGTVTANGGDSKDGSGGNGIYSSSGVAISGGAVTANGGDSKDGSGGNGIYSSSSVAISGGTVTATGGDSTGSDGSGGNGIYSRNGSIDLSGSLELTAKAGSPTGKALLQNGRELDLDTIKDKLGPGAKVTATDANGDSKQVSIPGPVEPEEPVIPEESSSSSDDGSATPSAPASPLPGLTVTDKDGQRISYTSTQSGNTLTVCVGRFTASFRISLAALRQLRAEGIETITFQTILCSTTLSVDELLAMGGEDAEAVLTHRFTDSSLTVG